MTRSLIVQIFKTEIADMTAFPVPFWVWRFRQLLQLVISVSLWQSVFLATSSAFGYEESRMLNYIILSSVISYVVMASKSTGLSETVHSGDLATHLLRPVSILKIYFIRDLADKVLNIMFALGEIALVVWLFQIQFEIPSIEALPLLIPSLFLSVVMYFFLNVLFGTIGFWSPDVWAPRFLFYTFMFLSSGYLFPIDIFPEPVFRVISLLPFPYLLYFPTQVLQGSLNTPAIIQGYIMTGVWCLIIGGLAFAFWNKGLRGYGSEGR